MFILPGVFTVVLFNWFWVIKALVESCFLFNNDLNWKVGLVGGRVRFAEVLLLGKDFVADGFGSGCC